MRDCPASAIEIAVVDKATKRFVMRFNRARCTYCAQCVVSCNFDAVGMSHECWELASLSQAAFWVSLGRPEDIEALAHLASKAAAAPNAPAAPPAPAPA